MSDDLNIGDKFIVKTYPDDPNLWTASKIMDGETGKIIHGSRPMPSDKKRTQDYAGKMSTVTKVGA